MQIMLCGSKILKFSGNLCVVRESFNITGNPDEGRSLPGEIKRFPILCQREDDP